MIRAKKKLRREMRTLLDGLSADSIFNDSRKLRTLLTFPPGSRVAIFAATKREPMLLELIPGSPHISWFLPKITGPGTMDFIHTTNLSRLRPGPFGILEPSEGDKASSLDVIVCPGLAFTKNGHRLGQGGGFYDRALARFPNARKIGTAFHRQILEELPHESHDAKMDAVFTPTPEPPNETPEY